MQALRTFALTLPFTLSCSEATVGSSSSVVDGSMPVMDGGSDGPSGPISGPAEGNVGENLPDMPLPQLKPDDIRINPSLGIATSMRHLLIRFQEETTVAEANEALLAAGGELVGTLADLSLVEVEFPADIEDAPFLDTYDRLSKHPVIQSVTYDFPLHPTRVPPPNAPTGVPFNWNWNLPPSGDNWGLEMINAPAAWNLIHAASRLGNSKPLVAAIDGFSAGHPDLFGVLRVGGSLGESHGIEVTGIIGATWGNRLYVDGISPYVFIDGLSYANPYQRGEFEFLIGFGYVLGQIERLACVDQAARSGARQCIRPRVVNMSIGYNWSTNCFRSERVSLPFQNCPGTTFAPPYRCDPREAPGIPDSGCCADLVRNRVIVPAGKDFGDLVVRVNREGEMLFVPAAGNDSGSGGILSGRWCYPQPTGIYNGPSGTQDMGNFPVDLASPWGWAAIHHEAKYAIIVAEASALTDSGQSERAFFSNVNGDGVFAPGVDVGTIAGTSVTRVNGTSFSAPHVVGAAAFLLWLCPNLVNAQLIELLTHEPYAARQSPSGSNTTTRLDLFGAVLGLDRLCPGLTPSVLTMLSDFDDGTQDGNLRVRYDDRGEPIEDCSECACSTEGDRDVNLRDFRRFRDSYLLDHGYWLDGDDSCKKDLNQNGDVQTAANGEVFARADLNGDGRVGDDPARFLDEELKDIEIFARAYEGDDLQNWSGDDLQHLLYSADLILRKDPGFAPPSVPYIVTIEGESDPQFPVSGDLDRTPLQNIRFEGDDLVVTTPFLRSPRIRFTAEYEGELDLAEIEMRLDDLVPGEDRVVVLGCPTLTINDTFVATASRTCNTSQWYACACFAATCATPCVGTATLEAIGGVEIQACAEDPEECPYDFEWSCENPYGFCSFSGTPQLVKTLHHSTTLYDSACELAEGTVTARVQIAGCPSWTAAEFVVPFQCESVLNCF